LSIPGKRLKINGIKTVCSFSNCVESFKGKHYKHLGAVNTGLNWSLKWQNVVTLSTFQDSLINFETILKNNLTKLKEAMTENIAFTPFIKNYLCLRLFQLF
jgi:hypothetical protein